MTLSHQSRRLPANFILSIVVAALLWFYMFSPWTEGLTNFWLTMSCAALCLTALVAVADRSIIVNVAKQLSWRQLLLGIAIAAVLWGIFWVGDKLSSLLFDFARPQVESIYGMKTGLPNWSIALLLLCLIGPAEEFFWRGYVQNTLAKTFNPSIAFFATTAVYCLVHIWSFNFMLIMSALVAGGFWGILFRLRPNWLPALVVSHAVWDTCVFALFPI